MTAQASEGNPLAAGAADFRTAGLVAFPTGWPHAGQNLAPAARIFPQLAQSAGLRDAPQLAQKRPVPATEQAGHITSGFDGSGMAYKLVDCDGATHVPAIRAKLSS